MSEEKETIIAELTARKNERIKQIQNEFEYDLLEAFGLKVGDKVKANFTWKGGSGKQSYSVGGELDGVLIEENGSLLVRSSEMKKKSASKNNGRRGRDFREWWEFADHYPETKITNIIFDEL